MKRREKMPRKKSLFYPYSKFDDYKGNGENCISWFISGRKKPIADYSKLICSSLTLNGSEEIERQQMALNEFFTDKEADQLNQYLSSHQEYSLGQFSVQTIALPVKSKLAPLSEVPRANYRYLYSLFKDEGYNLDFKVLGFYLGKYNHLLPKNYHVGSLMYKLYNDPIPV